MSLNLDFIAGLESTIIAKMFPINPNKLAMVTITPPIANSKEISEIISLLLIILIWLKHCQ